MGVGLSGVLGSGWVRLAAGAGALLCLVAAAASHSAPTADGVVNVRFGGDRNETRVVIELSRASKGKLTGDGSTGQPVVLALPGVPIEGDRQGLGLGLVSGWSLDSTAGAASIDVISRGGRPTFFTSWSLIAVTNRSCKGEASTVMADRIGPCARLPASAGNARAIRITAVISLMVNTPCPPPSSRNSW